MILAWRWNPCNGTGANRNSQPIGRSPQTSSHSLCTTAVRRGAALDHPTPAREPSTRPPSPGGREDRSPTARVAGAGPVHGRWRGWGAAVSRAAGGARQTARPRVRHVRRRLWSARAPPASGRCLAAGASGLRPEAQGVTTQSDGMWPSPSEALRLPRNPGECGQVCKHHNREA